MFISFYGLLEAGLFVLNGIAVLNKERFLNKVKLFFLQFLHIPFILDKFIIIIIATNFSTDARDVNIVGTSVEYLHREKKWVIARVK